MLERPQELHEIANVEHVLLSCDWGSHDPERAKRSVRRFTEKVLPKAALL